MEDLNDMTIEELFDKVISWSYEYKDRDDASDINFALGYIQEYLAEINKRTLAEICGEDEE